MVWEEVVSLLCWQGSTEQSSPARQPFAARQSVSRAVSSHWGGHLTQSPPPPPLPRSVLLYNGFLSVSDCLSICVSLLIQLCCLTPFCCLLSFFNALTWLALSFLAYAKHSSFPATLSHLPTPHLLPVYLSSVDCAGVTVSPPPLRLQQTLFTLLLNKPKGKHDPQWHALASLQYILNKPQRKKRGNLRGGGDKNLSFCLQAMSISAENIREW